MDLDNDELKATRTLNEANKKMSIEEAIINLEFASGDVSDYAIDEELQESIDVVLTEYKKLKNNTKNKKREVIKVKMNKYEGKYYVVRSDRAGVFAGEIIERNGQEVTMKNCRRIWFWDGACSLSELAKNGTKRPENCKFTVTVDKLEVLDVIEIIECTDKAKKSIKEVEEWKF